MRSCEEMAEAIGEVGAEEEEAVGEDALLEREMAEEGKFQCRECRKWITVFPYDGRRQTRWFAQMHCASMHLNAFVYQCMEVRCRQKRAKTWKALYAHHKQFHKRRARWQRVMPREEESRRMNELLNRCFPQVPFPPERPRF